MKVSRSIFEYKEKPHRETHTTYRRSSSSLPQYTRSSNPGPRRWRNRQRRHLFRIAGLQAVVLDRALQKTNTLATILQPGAGRATVTSYGHVTAPFILVALLVGRALCISRSSCS
jgi:hypothetical protein